MISRQAFDQGFARGIRYVLQKLERVQEARAHVSPDLAPDDCRKLRYDEAQNNLEGAISQLGDHLYDAMQSSVEP